LCSLRDNDAAQAPPEDGAFIRQFNGAHARGTEIIVIIIIIIIMISDDHRKRERAKLYITPYHTIIIIVCVFRILSFFYSLYARMGPFIRTIRIYTICIKYPNETPATAAVLTECFSAAKCNNNKNAFLPWRHRWLYIVAVYKTIYTQTPRRRIVYKERGGRTYTTVLIITL